MKKSLLAITLSSILAASAVIAATDNEAVKQRVDQIKSEFSLNDRQAQRIESIITRSGMNKEERRALKMERRMEHRMARMQEKLGLTDSQAEQMRVVMAEQRVQMQALHEQTRASMRNILTPEQFEKMEQMHSGRKGRGWGRGHHGHHGMHKGGYNQQ